MLFPLPKLSFSFKKIPMTWFLIFVNLFMFLFFSMQNNYFKSEMIEVNEDVIFVKTQSNIYKKFVLSHSEAYGFFTKSLINMPWESDAKYKIISSLAFSDSYFVDTIENEFPVGDIVAYNYWLKKFNSVIDLQATSPNYNLGILNKSSIMNFITYQFMHASFGHLFSNMIFLFIFGALIESLFGPLLLLISFLASGIIAAQSFLMVSQVINSPLVGASGSISGLMAMYCVAAFKRNIRYFYFLFIPRPQYMGFVYLPAWVLFLFWFMSDLAGFLSQISDHSGVAYIAHMGGQFAGAVVGLSLLLLWKLTQKNKTLFRDDKSFGHLEPLTEVIQKQRRWLYYSSQNPR